jgi:hypothetical protein
MSDPEHDAGMAVRREVLGDAHVDGALQRATAFTAPWQESSPATPGAPRGRATGSTAARGAA